MDEEDRRRWEIEKKIVKAFRSAVHQVCTSVLMKGIRDTIQSSDNYITKVEVASKLCANSGMVSRWINDGKISFEYFILLLTEYEIDLQDLSLPPIRQRWIAGFRAAIEQAYKCIISKGRQDQNTNISLSEPDFCILHCTQKDAVWMGLYAQVLALKRKESAKETNALFKAWEERTIKICKDAGDFRGAPIEHKAAAYCGELVEKWRRAFWDAHEAIPFEWEHRT